MDPRAVGGEFREAVELPLLEPGGEVDLVMRRQAAQQFPDVAAAGVVGFFLGEEKRDEEDFHGTLVIIALK